MLMGKELLPAKIPKHISLTVWKMFRKKKQKKKQQKTKQNKTNKKKDHDETQTAKLHWSGVWRFEHSILIKAEEHNYYKYGSFCLEPKPAGQFNVGFCWQLWAFLSLRGLFIMAFLVLFVFCGALWRSMFSCLVLFNALTLCVVGPVWPCDDLDGI